MLTFLMSRQARVRLKCSEDLIEAAGTALARWVQRAVGNVVSERQPEPLLAACVSLDQSVEGWHGCAEGSQPGEDGAG